MEVHPDDLGLNAVSPMEGRSKRRNTEGSEVETFPPEKAYLTKPVLDALMANLRIKRNEDDIGINESSADTETPVTVLPKELKSACVVRRSLDARKKRRRGGFGHRYNYVIDVEVSPAMAQKLRLKHRPGLMERISSQDDLSKRQSVRY